MNSSNWNAGLTPGHHGVDYKLSDSSAGRNDNVS